MDPLIEKFQSQDLIGWLNRRIRNRILERQAKGSEIKPRDYQLVHYKELVSLYGMISGLKDKESRYIIDSLIRLIRFLLMNRYEVRLGPKTGNSLGVFKFALRKSREQKVFNKDRETYETIDVPMTAHVHFKATRSLKEETTFVFCPFCEMKNGGKSVLFKKVDYREHVRKAHPYEFAVPQTDKNRRLL
jgi:nucleoid DNA-binding protein